MQNNMYKFLSQFICEKESNRTINMDMTDRNILNTNNNLSLVFYFDLRYLVSCKSKKSDTDPILYRLHYSELLESFTDYTHIFTDGSKDGDKTAAAFICQSFEFSKRLPDTASIFTAELEAIVSALRYIKITIKTINMLFLVTLNLRCRPCCPSGITPQFRLL